MYSYEQAEKLSSEYYNGNKLCVSTFLNKYALRDNEENLIEGSPDQMHRRLAKEFARIEKKKFKNPLPEDFIYALFEKFNCLIPQGSPMYGIGNYYKFITLSNCYVLESPHDSYSGIMKVDEDLVNISKRRGGVGICLDTLRPSGSPTHNSSRRSTGIPAFAERYSNSIREVGQDGRRGALMLCLNIHHPDSVKLLEGEPEPIVINEGMEAQGIAPIHTTTDVYNPHNIDFCSMKLDRTKCTGANISLFLTNEFLEAVRNDTDYEQRWPLTGEPKVRKMVNARKVWKKIIKCAWLSAEPGLLFLNNFLMGPADCYTLYKVLATNPCQPKWASVLTKKGLSTIGQIKVGDEIWSETGWTKVVNKWSTGKKRVFAYRTTFGTFYGTENHKLVSSGHKIEAKDAESIDILRGVVPTEDWFDNQTVMDGLVIGDGSVHKASNDLVILHIGEDDFDYFNNAIKDKIICKRDGISPTAWEIVTTIKHSEMALTYERKIPTRFLNSGPTEIRSFLRGLYSANGSICGGRITLKSASFDIIEQVQLMLSSIGIASYYTTNKKHIVQFENGEYESKESYDLNITRDKDKFAKLIGFIQEYKNEKLSKLLNKTSSKPEITSKDICEVTEISYEEVFDITVDNEPHTYWTGGLNVSNCAEIGMCANDSCRLLLLNLLKFVKNPFTPEAYFDYKAFYEMAQIAQRLMDDLVDLEAECIERIIQKIKDDPEPEEVKQRELDLWNKILYFNNNGRRTGTGLTALGDTLAFLGIKYGSEESIVETEKIYKTLKFGCYRSSVDMAKELGPFTDYDASVEKDCDFLNRIKDEILDISIPGVNHCVVLGSSLFADMKKYGRRNIACTTTPPAGTTSLHASYTLETDLELNAALLTIFGTSSGIEPAYMMAHWRNKKVNPHDEGVKVDFVDAKGDSWQKFKVYHEPIKLWMLVTGETDENKSPWAGACANDISWTQRVKLQAAAQKHVCHSISSTINLPNNVTEEEVAEIYLRAWEDDVKGITIYRDGCRTGILTAIKSETVAKHDAPKRPQSLDCDIHYTRVGSNSYAVVVGTLEGEPYEIFVVNSNKLINEKDRPKSGKIKRHKRGVYELLSPEGETLDENIAETVSDNEEAIARLISSNLRHGCDIKFLTHQLEKTHGDLFSFSKAIARVLKKYIKDGESVTGEECKECGGKLIRQSGCIQCSNCGWSKC